MTRLNNGRDQSKRRQFVIGIGFMVVTAAFIGVLYQGLKLDPSSIPSSQVGKPAFDFTAHWIQGQEDLPSASSEYFNISDLKGHNVVLNFWASWCVSCRAEAKDLETFWQAFKGEGIMVVGVAIQDTVEAAKDFADFYGKRYPLGIDADGKAAINYGVTGVPETFFINKDGIVVHKVTGPVDLEMLRDAVKYF